MYEDLNNGDIIRHFKGTEYSFVSWAKHTETAELLMIYRTLDGLITYARPHTMFYNMVEHEGALVPRFAKV